MFDFSESYSYFVYLVHHCMSQKYSREDSILHPFRKVTCADRPSSDFMHLLKHSITLSFNVMFMSTLSEFFILICCTKIYMICLHHEWGVLSKTLTLEGSGSVLTSKGETCASELPPSALSPPTVLSLSHFCWKAKSHLLDFHPCLFC